MTDFADGVLRNASTEIADKTRKVVAYIGRAADLGADIAVFPEMALVRYEAELISAGTAADIDAAEAAIAAQCRARRIWAIVGLPKYFDPNASAQKLPWKLQA